MRKIFNRISLHGGIKMILHCRNFTVDGYPLTMGHDRETQKRFFCVEISCLDDVQRFIPKNAENGKFWDKIKSIFWLK